MDGFGGILDIGYVKDYKTMKSKLRDRKNM